MTATPAAFYLDAHYVHLEDGAGATSVPITPEFWERMDPRFDDGRLLGVFQYDADWPNWEMHPDGDEFVYLLSGAMDLMLDVDGGERRIILCPGMACIVPGGVWHRGIVHRPGAALHVTRGAGTQHRPVVAG